MMRPPLTTHVLDTSRGCPAGDLPIRLEILEGEGFSVLGEATTNDDGRIEVDLTSGRWTAGTYRLRFETAGYFEALGLQGFYPYVEIVFTVTNPTEHHHVPLLLNPFGYSTYRGS